MFYEDCHLLLLFMIGWISFSFNNDVGMNFKGIKFKPFYLQSYIIKIGKRKLIKKK